MYLTNAQRTRKLLFSLLSKPGNICSYFLYSLTSKSPLELAMPWWSLDAIRALENHLSEKHEVFEWGSGGSTLYLAKRAKKVTTVEQHPEWLEKVRVSLEKDSLANVSLLFRNLDISDREAFESCPYAKALESTKDVIIVDGEDAFGPDSQWSAREICFQIAEKWIKKIEGLIVVDDSWRYPAIRSKTKAKRLVVHESTGPCRRGVTSTDFHYY